MHKMSLIENVDDVDGSQCQALALVLGGVASCFELGSSVTFAVATLAPSARGRAVNSTKVQL